MDKEITIIIVNWNTRDMLKSCLYSVKKSSYANQFEIIVVDNASRDGSREMIKSLFPGVQIINSGRNIGFAAANNLAIRRSNTQFILFLNPDTVVFQNSISKMVDFLKVNLKVGAVGCKMMYESGEVQPLGLQWFPSPLTELLSFCLVSTKTINIFKKYLPYKDPNSSGYVKKLYGGCLMVRREILEKVGYFDERFFMYGEDVDLCNRIIQDGWKLFYLCEAEIIHHCGGSSSKTSSMFLTQMKCESVSKLMHKYYGKKGKLLYKLVVFFGSNVRLLILFVIRIFTLFFPIGKGVSSKNSFNKHITMIKWSLNLQKPVIKS